MRDWQARVQRLQVKVWSGTEDTRFFLIRLLFFTVALRDTTPARAARRRKRGKRGGTLVRFRKRVSRPSLPAIMLSNVRSLKNKMDEVLYSVKNVRDYRDSSVICFTETWLDPTTPDSAVSMCGYTLHRADRCPTLTGKSKGGGICFYVNHRWCRDSVVLSSSCSADIETLVIKCSPFYSPREIASLILVGVYIPPQAHAVTTSNFLCDLTQSLECSYPDSKILLLGDFNHVSTHKTLPKYKKQVRCSTRDGRTLDQCYCTIGNAYHAVPRAPLGRSDHCTVLLLPAYRQRLKSARPAVKSVRRWNQDSIAKLQGCLECTDWDALTDSCADIHERADVITSYVSFCEEVCIPTRQVRSWANDKPWFSSSLKAKVKAKEAAHRSGDKAQYKRARYDLEKAIRSAKWQYKKRLESQFQSNNTRAVWQGLQTITDYKKRPSADVSDKELPDRLNEFYARFDQQNSTPVTAQRPDSAAPLPPPFTVKESDVLRLLKRQNSRKAAGPDGVSAPTLKHCSSQLAPVFTEIFNSSLQLSTVPSCFKTSIIIPVPKKAKATSMNDFRPVALTSLVMKVLERLVLKHVQSITKGKLDPLQFAYQANRSVDDAVALALHFILQHLESPNRYARLLFVDYSSAFNTIIPQKFFDKLHALSLSPSIRHWLLDFLLHRPQAVKVNGNTSKTLVLSTGAPQGCVLSPLLFCIFTNDCISHHDSVQLVKFADDTTVEGIISGGDESAYRQEVDRLVSWCTANDLELNTAKTKEMVVDFRRNLTPIDPLIIHGEAIEIVDSFRFLGTIISNNLSWNDNTDAIVKRAHQRLYFLRQLRKFGLSREILLQFYRCVIESVLTFSICTWYGAASQQAKARLDRVVRSAGRIIGSDLPSLDSIYAKRMLGKSRKIAADPSHPASSLFQPLPSRRRYRALRARTNRLQASFFPQAVAVLNSVQTEPLK